MLNKHTLQDLKELQNMSFDEKLNLTKDRIIDWYWHWKGQVYVSISGKDSTVLLDIVRRMFPDVPAVYVMTGLEYPEVTELAVSHDNVIVLHPELPFFEVIKKYGYPIISKEVSECIDQARKALKSKKYNYRLDKVNGTAKDKDGNKSKFDLSKWKPLLDLPFRISNQCCNIMKKKPAHKYAKETGRKPMTGQMAVESRLRTQQWLKNGCNGFQMKSPVSNPMSFWNEQDVLRYIKEYNVKIPSVYGDIVEAVYDTQNKVDQLRLEGCGKLCTTGCDRTGCIYCGFGTHLEKGITRFQRLKETHHKLYEYCMGGGEFDKEGMWIPNKNGLGLKFVFDKLNEIYGENFIRYK